MPENRFNPQPQDEERKETSNLNDARFESDTDRIVHRHLKNKNDIITDDDIAGVRVGMVPPEFDNGAEAGLENEEAGSEAEEDFISNAEEMSKEKNAGERQITPWDAIDPTE